MSALQILDLDFSSRKRPLKPLGLAFLGAGVASSILITVQLASAYHVRNAERARYEEAAAKVEVLRAGPSNGSPMSPADIQRYRNASLVAQGLATPWDDMLKSIEGAPMERVALLSIEPVASQHQIRLSGEAKNLPAMLDYIAYLQRESVLRHVLLTSHQVQANVPGTPVRFQIQAQWGHQ